MSEYGLKIKNIKAGTLYGYNLGVRTHYNFTGAMFSNSLFSQWILSHGMSSYKGESTRDIICLDFDFGSRSFEEERDHLKKLIQAEVSKDQPNPDKVKSLEDLLATIEHNKDKYRKMSKEEIRELFYRDGVDVEYKTQSGGSKVIHYRMLYRNASKAKLGQVMFIKERLWARAMDWLTMGLYRKMPNENAKIVELSAYAPLTTSTIVDTIHIPVEDILILEDQDSFFRTVAKVVYAEPDESGAKRCYVKDGVVEVKNTLWDGQALIDTEFLSSLPNPPEANGMVLLRNHMFKACAFKTRIQQFFRDWCATNGHDYNTYEVPDMFGNLHLLKNVKVVTTDNATKFKKFSDLMGGDFAAAYQYWCGKIRDDGNTWGVVKTDHPSKLGDVQQMSYQMVNTLPCTKDEIKDIAQTSIDYVELLKTDNEAFVSYLIKNANVSNHYEMLAALYHHNPDFADSRFFRTEKRKIINKYVFKLRGGKITVNGDNLTLCGNPYALLLHSVGDDWRDDPSFATEPGAIQCYTKRFRDGEYLCGFRSPHNSCNNCVYLHNVYSDPLDKYFDFSDNIVAINCIGTDVQSRLNGADLTYKVGFRET